MLALFERFFMSGTFVKDLRKRRKKDNYESKIQAEKKSSLKFLQGGQVDQISVV